MDEEVEIEWAVGCLAHSRDLLPHHVRRLAHAPDRAQASGIADGRHERRRCEAAHRRLNDRMNDAQQFEEISVWPHEITLRS